MKTRKSPYQAPAVDELVSQLDEINPAELSIIKAAQVANTIRSYVDGEINLLRQKEREYLEQLAKVSISQTDVNAIRKISQRNENKLRKYLTRTHTQ